MGIFGFGRSNSSIIENKVSSLINEVYDSLSDCDSLSSVKKNYLMKESIALVYFLYIPQIAGKYNLSRQEFQSVCSNVFKRFGLSNSDLADMDNQYVWYQKIRQSEGVAGVAKEAENRICNLADDGSPCAYGKMCRVNLSMFSNMELKFVVQDTISMILKAVRG